MGDSRMFDSFSVETSRKGAIWIFSTRGYINNQGGEAIAREFDDVFQQGGRKILFNLAGSKIINSIGVSFLIEILEKLIESEGTMAFCNCVPIIEKTFRIMGITQYAKIYDTEEEAVGGMSEES
jgi:anti-anti-sigma factor